MHESIIQMIKRYPCKTSQDYKNALKEIIQETALFGLWRAKFFEHAAFYGGTALRILYGLDRFSEDLDFSLLSPDTNFDLNKYEKMLKQEIESFGLPVSFQYKLKSQDTKIQSAFIKADTLKHIVEIGIPSQLQKQLHQDELIKIKLELDTDPPSGFQTESKALLYPLPFSVRSYTLSDLMAGKIHALLFRQWNHRVKGRDWYDFLWFLKKGVEVNLAHLSKRMEQTGHLKSKELLTHEMLLNLLTERIQNLDIESAKKDILRFAKDPRSLEAWSTDFFLDTLKYLKSR